MQWRFDRLPAAPSPKAVRARGRGWTGRRRRQPYPPQSGGFSLIEVLVATALLVTAVASLAQLLALATRANAAAGDMTVATVLAAQKVEELRAAPLQDLRGVQAIDYVDSRGQTLGGAVPTRGRVYRRRWWVAAHRAGAAPAASGLTVAVIVAVSGYRQGDGRLAGPTGPAGDQAPEEIVRIVTLRTGAPP